MCNHRKADAVSECDGFILCAGCEHGHKQRDVADCVRCCVICNPAERLKVATPKTVAA